MNSDQNGLPASGARNPGKKKKQGKFSWPYLAVDAALIALIVLAILYVVSLTTTFSFFGNNRREKCTLLITMEVPLVPDDSVDMIRIGDVVTDEGTGKEIGKVSAVDIGACLTYSTDAVAVKEAEGTYAVPTVSYGGDYHTLTVYIATDAEYEEGYGYTADGVRLAIGREYALRFSAYAGDALCTGLTK